MRSLVLVLFVVSCGGGDQVVELDAGVDGAPGEVLGAWRVEWMCELGCEVSPGRPALTYSGLVDVELDRVRWHDDDCAECSEKHAALALTASCVDVGAGAQGRAPYRLCNVGEVLSGVVEWTSPFSGDSTRWTVRGVR